MWLPLFAVAALAEPPRPVPPTVDLAQEADLQFRLGLRAYQARDLDEALEHLLASNRLAPNANVLFNLGRVHEARKDLPSAWRCYDQYVRVETDAARRREAEEAIARIEPEIGRVRVVSEPPGAAVYLERVELGSRGVTPVTLAVPAGAHRLLVAASGAEPAVRAVDVAAGDVADVVVPVAAAAGEPATAAPWVAAAVTAAGRPLLRLDDVRCTLLDDIPARLASEIPDTPLVGAALAAGGADEGLVVDVQAAGRPTIRAALAPLDKRALALRDSAPLRPVFDRCVPGTPARVAVALEALPKRERLDAVRVFAEWAAWRGAADVQAAAARCLGGDCTDLATALARDGA